MKYGNKKYGNIKAYKRFIACTGICIGGLLLCSCPAGIDKHREPHFSHKKSVPPLAENKEILPRPESGTLPAKPPFTGTEEERKKIIFERMLNAVLRFETDADVSEFAIGCGRENEEHKTLYNEFLRRYPFVFHIVEDGGIAYNYNPHNENELTKYRFDYKVYPHSLERYFARLEAGIEAFYGHLREPMTDAEIAYTLHNALAEKTEYNDGMHSADTFGALIDGKAICQGYSLAYRRLLRGIGIESDFVDGPSPNDPQGHMWNKVQIDGNWYNSDLTWDDNAEASKKARSYSFGTYFLTSDTMFYGVLGHLRPGAQSYTQACTDTKYDSSGGIFRRGDEKTPPLYHEGFWYWLSHTDKTIYKSRFDGSEKTALYTLKNKLNNYAYKRLELGKSGLYFINTDPAQPKKDYIHSIGYSGGNVQKHAEILFAQVLENTSLVGEDDKLTVKRGKNALRGELMLSKMKDAYYHGNEDYFTPQAENRKKFTETIKKAEKLVNQADVSDNEAENLYNILRDMRKNYSYK
ncbi:hypothetical protein H0R92_06635 [Treponema sp. OMZ 840]|uniref:transglutaminase domain-containing protein n=1 Tax=Treponema sp. OMZ 840 TaxID=244313 RepID=UPI003D8B18D2